MPRRRPPHPSDDPGAGPLPASVRVQWRLGVIAVVVGIMLAVGNIVHAQDGAAGGQQQAAAAQQQGVECTITMPAHALTAQGLASPWELSGNGKGCDETVKDEAAFVDATIFDPATNELSI